MIIRTVDPTGADIKRLAQTVPLDTPVIMLNLLRYRERAVYPPSTTFEPCSGREAYERYAAVAVQKVTSLGGKPLVQLDALARFIGPEGEEWDEMLLVRYPSVAAFLNMLKMPDYLAATVHRTAALEDARLVVMCVND